MYYLLFLIIAGLAAHFGSRQYATRLKNNPNPYSLETLTKPLTGEETCVEREDGTQIWAISKGTGPTVVLSHGYGVTSEEWNVVWDMLLQAGHRVIAFDLRGHGKSTIGSGGLTSKQMADDYRAVLEHFDVRDAILVGHSTGGFLSLAFLLNHPEVATKRLKGAVIASSLGGNALKDSFQNRLQIPAIKSGMMQRIMASDTYGWYFGASLSGEPVFPAAVQAFNRVFLQQKHENLIPILQFLVDEDLYPRMPEIKLPCVILCGDKDKTTPAWHSTDMGRLIPNARNVWVKNKGHLINWEAPEAIVEAIRSL